MSDIMGSVLTDKNGRRMTVVDQEARNSASQNARRINELSEEIEEISSMAATTVKGYKHSDLSGSEKGITLYKDENFASNPHIFLGEDYWLRSVYSNVGISYGGLSFDSDGYKISIKGTANRGSQFYVINKDDNDYRLPLPEGLNVGDVVRIYLFGNVSETNSPFAQVAFYDSTKTRISNGGMVQTVVKAGESSGVSGTLKIPDGAVYMHFALTFANGSFYNSTVMPVLVKSSTTVNNSIAFDGETVATSTDSECTTIVTIPHMGVVSYVLPLKEYIDRKQTAIDIDTDAINADMSFVTPEMFGAYADGVHDDTEAVQSCINYAVANHKKAFGAAQYITSSPIEIVGNAISAEINAILYSGTEYAVRLDGTQNTIRITRITSQCLGLLLKSDTNYTSYNDINIGSIVASKGCVKYEATNKSMVGNRLTFGYLETAETYNCIECNSEDWRNEVWIGNNNFIGGRFVNGNWGAYNLNGNDVLTTCQFEGVKNAAYFCSVGALRVIAPRYAELCYHCYDYAQPNRPKIAGKGTLFKIAFPTDYREDTTKTCCVDLAPAAGRIMPANIDLTDALIETIDGMPLSKQYPGPALIRARLESRFTHALADEFYTFGQHIIIKRPALNEMKHIAAGDGGYAGDYTITDTDNEFLIYTEYIVDDAGCDYKLPPSYDMIGMDKFIVTQPTGTSCTLRDWRGTVIFDGATLGEGRYELRARLRDGASSDYYDNRNQVWDVYKIAAPVATV